MTAGKKYETYNTLEKENTECANYMYVSNPGGNLIKILLRFL